MTGLASRGLIGLIGLVEGPLMLSLFLINKKVLSLSLSSSPPAPSVNRMEVRLLVYRKPNLL